MTFLISNDDGIEAAGIRALAGAFADLGDVVVVAPHRERSTSGHSLTLHKPLRVFDLGEGRYSTTGSPADCIYLGARQILKSPPDIILSGINQGANLGTDVHYSGTVAAAREGAVMNIRSYAFSLVDLGGGLRPEMFPPAAQFCRKVVEATKDIPFPKHTLINVNIPNVDPQKVRGMRLARQGIRYYSGDVTARKDPRGRDYYWIGGSYLGFEENRLADCTAVQEGWVSVTPITLDCTHNEFYTTLGERSLAGEWKW